MFAVCEEVLPSSPPMAYSLKLRYSNTTDPPTDMNVHLCQAMISHILLVKVGLGGSGRLVTGAARGCDFGNQRFSVH